MKLITMQQKIQGAAAIALMLSASFMCGCTQPQTNEVLQKIAAQIPTAIAVSNTIGPLIATLDPAIAPAVGVGMAAINAALPMLQNDINAYLANPNGTQLGRIESTINELLTQGTAALQIVGIKNEGRQVQITAALGSLNALLIVIDGLIQQIQPASVTKANAAARSVKLSQIDRFLDHEMLERSANEFGTSYAAFYSQQTAAGF